MEPFRNPQLSPEERTEDLLGRLSLPEKVGLMFQTVIETGPEGTLLENAGDISKSSTSKVVLGKLMNHFNVHALGTPREAARWNNALQALAAQTPHGIPVTISTDPRHAQMENKGMSFTAGHFSRWPETLGLAALPDSVISEYAEVVRREYVAVGIRAALHPQVDLATEPRWGRQIGTFGADPARVSRACADYLTGMQISPELGPESVACVTKHFPGGGPQKDGEDSHFPYGREEIYPGNRFADHLAPFLVAIELGTAGMMPYYGMPVGLVLDGVPIEEVGFGYNRQIITSLLREQLGYQGVVLTDWELINDNHVGDKVLPARAWGVEELTPPERLLKLLNAGCDQFGGEECVDLLLDLVRSGRVPESRLDESVRRILLVKFRLGLFENPYVSEDDAAAIVGNVEFRAAGHRAQAQSTVVLVNRDAILPLRNVRIVGPKVYVEGIEAAEAARIGTVVADPAEADLALVRIAAPFEPRHDLFLEAEFHQGSLDFPPGLVVRMARIAAHCPLVLDISLDRPAIVEPLLKYCAALTVSFGSSDAAWLDAITGVIPARGKLPIDIPSSMAAVRVARSDVPNDTANPSFKMGDGIAL
ncbi:MAG: glycoside hydrolase family 3 protein [Promicromonosporaceae bacterium]|nr:glycoside hydrolase family 3 protein [Promicromonosporaceae bacterium]